MWRKSRGALFLTILLFSMTTLLAGEEPLSYPKTRRVDHTNDYHGTKVADPYRWLEDDVRKSPAVAEWVAEENKLTFAYLHAIPVCHYVCEGNLFLGGVILEDNLNCPVIRLRYRKKPRKKCEQKR